MGFCERDISKIRSHGKFIVAPRDDEERGHLPITPAPVESEWQGDQNTQADLAIMLPASGRYCPPEMHVAMAALEYPRGLRVAVLALKGVRRDEARVEMILQAQKMGVEFGLFIDDDNPPPKDTVVKLLDVMKTHPDAGIAAGIYVNRGFPLLPFVFRFTDNPEGFFWNWKAELRDAEGNVTREGEIFECDAIATGCMMIRMAVFHGLAEPWFYECHSMQEAQEYYKRYSTPPPRKYVIEVTDDMWFCGRVQEAGWKLYGHGGVLPKHWDDKGNAFELAADTYPMRP